MSDGENGDSWLSLRGVQQASDLQRFSFHPIRKTGRGEQVIELDGKVQPIITGKKGLEIKNAHLVKRRGLNLIDQVSYIQASSFSPGLLQYVGD